ncbi:MAG: hypothetical protein ACTSRW_10450 [Candidatus Helarchaeota archaeon]
MVVIINVKKAYFDMQKAADFHLSSLEDLKEMAESKGIEVIYKNGKDYLLIDNQQNYFYAAGPK